MRPFHLAISVDDLAVDPTTPTTLYAATFNGLFRSINGAASWTPLFTFAPVASVTVDPVSANAIFGLVEYGVSRGLERTRGVQLSS